MISHDLIPSQINPCLHTHTVHKLQNGMFDSEIECGFTEPVVGHLNYFEEKVVPLYKFEKQPAFNCFSASQGRARSYRFFHRDVKHRRRCFVKVEPHRGVHVVRCVSSEGGHYGPKCHCCNDVFEWWVVNNPSIPVQLFSPAPRPPAASSDSQDVFFSGHGDWLADTPPDMWNEPNWWERGDKTLGMVRIPDDELCAVDLLSKYSISLFPARDQGLLDGVSSESRVVEKQEASSIVYGAKFASHVNLTSL